MAKDGWLFDLRRGYPTIEALTFLALIEKHLYDDDLLEKLEAAEVSALRQKVEFEKRMDQVQRRLSVNDTHHRIPLPLVSDLDLEHAQAVLAYGFIMPGKQNSVFAGAKTVPIQHVRTNVRHKLGTRFDEDRCEKVLAYFIREGVVNTTGTKSKLALSLNLDSKSASIAARPIISAAKSFLRYK